MFTALDHSAPQIGHERLQCLLTRRQALPRRRPRIEVLRLDDMTRRGVLEPVDILEGRYI